MGLISIGGLGSGLDTKSIVDALVAAERAPKQNSLDRLEADVTVTLTGLGNLKSALDELKTASLDLSLTSNFSKRSVTVSSSEFFTATATSSASSGQYDIEVTSLAVGSTHQSQVFTGGSSTTFGDGTLTFTIGSNTFDVAVSSTDTLSDIRNNINAASDNSFVSVNLLNNVTSGPDTGSILTFDSSTTGTGNDLAVTYSGDASLANLSTNLTQTQTAGDAGILVDGLAASSSNNTFTDIIQGVTITTAKEHSPSGTTDSLTVSLDTASTKSLITSFVTTFNAFVDVTKELGSANTAQPGILLGDSTLRQAESQIRNLISSTIDSITGDFNSLSAIGITTTQTGYLEIDNDVLDKAIDDNFEQLDDLFTSTDGFATQLRSVIDTYTSSSGVISSRESSLNEQLGRIANDRLSLDLRIESLQLRLTQQFAVMDAAVAQFNSTQSYIAQQFANLPGFSSGNKDN
ncbi:MAG: flagellar filament capping protein FliD [Kangiellaceae bacterium]|nr:flagellar filament capping protein FliD [Kangiellaceae bacterium]MCW8999533.1 flagellar filament capping protein FliD [Kangiellaceae bacterium]